MTTRLLFIFSFLLCMLQGVAQRDKEFQIRLGIGSGVYSTNTTIKYTANAFGFSVPLEYKDDGGALTVHMPIELRYELIDRFNLGLDMKFGSYLYEDNTNETQSNSFRSFGLCFEYAFLSRENSRLYVGTMLGSTYLEMNEKVLDWNSVIVDSKWIWRAPSFKLNLGYIKYFGDSPIGININLGWNTQAFKLKEWQLPFVTFSNLDGKLNASGVDMAFGLVFRIRQK
jgi:hypothetical protein